MALRAEATAVTSTPVAQPREAAVPRTSTLLHCSLAGLARGGGALYLWQVLDSGWVPHDEGALAESARRVLAGELPPPRLWGLYTGGLSYLNALAPERSAAAH